MPPTPEKFSGVGGLLLGQRGQVPVSKRKHVWLLCQKREILKAD